MGAERIKYYLDLLIALLLGFLSLVFVLIPPFNQTPLRIVFSLPIILFVPGYMFISAMFPRRDEISYIERFTLSVGFSIAISVFDGFLLSISPWLYRPLPTVISLLGFSILFAIITLFLRNRLREEERFYLPLGEVREFFREYVAEIHLARATSRLHALKVALGLEAVGEVEDVQGFEVSKILIIAMILSILVASGMLIYAKTTREPETFTALYILGPGGKAENYPSEIILGEPLTVLVGVENYEHAIVNYTLDVQLDGKTLAIRNITLAHGEKWEENVSIISRTVKPGGGRSKLEFQLFKEGAPGVYRSVNLWLNRSYSRAYLIENSDKLTVKPLPVLKNGDFNSLEGWSFTSTENIASRLESAGGRTRVFIFNISGRANNTQTSTLHQRFNSTSGLATLSFHVNASLMGRGKSSATVQAVLNRERVWQKSLQDITHWLHVRVPVTLREGSNTLSFQVQVEKGNAVPMEVYLDEVEFKPLSALPRVEDFAPPTSRVEPLPPVIAATSFRVNWSGSDEDSGIDYYNVDYSSDGVNWKRWLTGTRATSQVFNGSNAQTYYFRSQAVDRAGNIEQPHTTPDANTTVDVTAPDITVRVVPDPSRGPVSFEISSNKVLAEASGFVRSEKFNTTTNITLENINGTHWRGAYNANFSGRYVVSVVGFDEAGNRGEGAAPFTVNTNIANLSVTISPAYTSGGDVRIVLLFGDALREEPDVSIRDSGSHIIKLLGPTVDGTEYTYHADINSSVQEGRARVSITARNVFNERISRTEYFIVDRTPPVIQTVSPAENSSVSNTTTIEATYKESSYYSSGVDTGCIALWLNGSSVPATVSASNLSYTPPSPLPAGLLTAKVSVCDMAGNVASRTWQFTVQ